MCLCVRLSRLTRRQVVIHLEFCEGKRMIITRKLQRTHKHTRAHTHTYDTMESVSARLFIQWNGREREFFVYEI